MADFTISCTPTAGTVTRPARVLTLLIAMLATAASLGGLLLPGLYRDNAFTTSTWLGNDLATLLVTVPILLISLGLAVRGSDRAYLVWLALLDTTLYNFGFYLFGTAFNWFFLVYVALFGLSIWALFIGLANLDVDAFAQKCSTSTPVRSIAVFMAFVGVGLTSVYVAQWAAFVATGVLPPIITMTEQHTNVVFALDLALVIPMLVVGAIWLWQRRPWGFAIAGIITVKGAVYMVGLCASTYTAFRAGTVESLAQIGLWASIGIGCAIAAVVLLGNLKESES